MKGRRYWNVGFIDPGGTIDFYFLVLFKVDTKTRTIYVTGAMSWKLQEGQIGFREIRRDIASLYRVNRLDLLGCEKNNYGRSEIEAMRNEHGIRMVGINTSGKVTSEKVERKGETMDKHQMVRWTNSWRTAKKIKIPSKITDKHLKRWKAQFDTFIVKKSKSTGNPKYEAEGRNHDDAALATLGGLHLIKTRIFKIIGFARTVRTKKMLPRTAPRHSRDGELGTGLSGSQQPAGRAHVSYSGGVRDMPRYRIR